MQAMGRAVVEILVEQLENPAATANARRLPVRVVLRESCGCSRA